MKPYLFLLLALITLGTIQTKAQTKHAADSILMLTADGKETWVTDISFVTTDSAYLWHDRMLYKQGQTISTLLPTEAKEAVRQGKHYLSIETVQKDGSQKRIFAPLDYDDAAHGLKIYKRLLASGRTESYVQFHDGVAQYADDTNGQSNPLRQHLLEQNKAQGGNEAIADYIGRVKADESDLKTCYDIITRQNPNRIPRWRVGVSAGASLNNFDIDEGEVDKGKNHSYYYGSESLTLPAIALYADYRMTNGISGRIELNLQSYSLHQVSDNQVHDTIDVDCTVMSLPLLARYTMVNLRGQWLPYIEAGLQLNFAMTNKNRQMKGERNGSGQVIGYTEVEGNKNGLIYPQLLCGAGIEYVLSPKHSLYLGARYLLPYTHDTGNKVDVKHGSLALTLSFDIF